MVHEIKLSGYVASCSAADNVLQLGTAGSYGIERLHITSDSAWDGLTLTASFTNAGRTTTVSVIDNMVDVPPEATQDATRDRVRYGVVVFTGCDADGTVRRISTSLLYVVLPHGGINGKNTITPTPDQYAQFVASVKADADRAEAAASGLTNDVIAAINTANGAAQSARTAAESASSAASAANNAASAATTAKTEANNAAYAANTAASAANTAKTEADSAAAAANTAAELANAAKNAADNAASAANTAASGASTAATAANNATQQAQSATTNAQAAAAACQNIAAGINSMADDATGKTYTIGIHAGMVYLQEV